MGRVLEAEFEIDRRDFGVEVRLAVAPGERLALFGPSGAGKTTILEVIAGLATPRRGLVSLAGRVLTRTAPPRVSVPPWRRRTGLLRQDPGLFPHMSVRHNLEYGAGHQAAAQTVRLASELEIAGLLGERPARLSGGQAHRVAIGRLLLARCEALLLDEPYTGLDAGLRRVLTGLVRSLAAERAIPAILVAHELADAQAFADRLAVLDRGRLLAVGPADEVVRRPATRRVAELVGYRSFVPVPPAGARMSPAPAPASGDGAVVAGVHPDRVIPGSHPGRGLVLSGPVRTRHPAGAGWEAEVMAGQVAVWCRMQDPPPDPAVITVLGAPCFGPDGALLPPAAWA